MPASARPRGGASTAARATLASLALAALALAGPVAACGRERPAPPGGDTTTTTAADRAPLVVRVLDVGQGDATLVEHGGSRVLVDGGPSMARMGDLLDSLGLNGETIDVVVLTHPHLDHLGGLRELFRTRRDITVRYLFEARDPRPGTSLAQLRDSANARARRGELELRDADDPCGDGRAACTLTLRGGGRLHVLRPAPTGGPNDRSVPVKLVGPDSAFAMWLAGDAERDATAWFDRTDYDVRPGMDVDVLKLSHHGSCDGTTARLLRLTSPRWAVVSLADDNEYGHVHAQTKAMLRAAGVPWYRTDVNGTITIRAPGPSGEAFEIVPSRGAASAGGRMDRRSTQDECARG